MDEVLHADARLELWNPHAFGEVLLGFHLLRPILGLLGPLPCGVLLPPWAGASGPRLREDEV